MDTQSNFAVRNRIIQCNSVAQFSMQILCALQLKIDVLPIEYIVTSYTAHWNEKITPTKSCARLDCTKNGRFCPTHYVGTGCLPLAFYLPTILLRSQWLRPSPLPRPPSSSPFPSLFRLQLSPTFLRSDRCWFSPTPFSLCAITWQLMVIMTSFQPCSQAGDIDHIILGTRLYR